MPDQLIAVNRRRRNPDGTWVEEVDYFDVECFDGLAEVVLGEVHKGTGVIVSGQLRQSRWKDAESGKTRSRVLLRASEVAVVLRPKSRGAGRSGETQLREQRHHIEDEIFAEEPF
jgi:single-strand DNA-binding protein